MRFSIVIVLAIIGVGTSAFAEFGYTTINPPPTGEKGHAQILNDIYNQNFTASGLNYVSDGGITAYRVYDYNDDMLYNTTHVDAYNSNGVDQIWIEGGTITVTALAEYASYTQAFGWNTGGQEGNNFTELVDQDDIGEAGISFHVTSDAQFLWGYRAEGSPHCGWWPPSLEWWSYTEENNNNEDHMVTYFIEGVSSGETVWVIFMEDLRFCESDKDYNDFVVEIRAAPEPASILLLGLGTLALLKKRRALRPY